MENVRLCAASRAYLTVWNVIGYAIAQVQITFWHEITLSKVQKRMAPADTISM